MTGQRKKFPADALTFAVDLLRSGAEFFEDVFGHGEGDLAFSRENAVGPYIREFVGLTEVGGAGNDRDGRIEAAGFHDAIARARTGGIENKDPRISETGVLI